MSETNNVENKGVNGETEQNNIPAEATPEKQEVEGTATESAETATATMPEEPHQDHEI